MSVDPIIWIILGTTIAVMLTLDLVVFNRHAHVIRFREAAFWSAVWVSLGLAFGVLVWDWLGPKAGGEYLAGYILELSLSMDNVFLFAMIFAYFAVPAIYQHRLLFYGVLGAIVFRLTFIVLGTALLSTFHALIYVLGALLLFTGYRMARADGHGVDPERNPVLRAMRRIVPISEDYRGGSFLVRHPRLMATPLLAVLVVIETSDILFALDSIPAIFAVTTSTFIVFSSNAFAILGLRSLYFLLAGLLDRFVYLRTGLAILLVFAGVKILISEWLEIPVVVTLGIIVGILGIAIGASLWKTRGLLPVGVTPEEGVEG